MAILRATVSLADLTGIDENRFVNVWHFDTTGTDEIAASTAVITFLPVFYQNTALAALFSPTLSRVALVHRITTAVVTPGGAGPADDTVSRPIDDTTFTISTAPPAGGFALPHEVACCLSFAGNLSGIPEEGVGDTRPAARRRGRVYIGPFNHTTMNGPGGAFGARPSDELRNAMIEAYLPVVASLKTVSPPVVHGIYSRALGTITPVKTVSVDDAWDTIRSRGMGPSNRITAGVP